MLTENTALSIMMKLGSLYILSFSFSYAFKLMDFVNIDNYFI